MTIPYIHNHPVLRPGFIEQVQWVGSDEDLSLQVSFRNQAGELTTKSFQTQGDNPGEICLPTNKTIDDLSEDTLMASLLMASLLAAAVPGTAEWAAQFSEQLTPRLQTAIGDVVMITTTQNPSGVTPISDALFSIQLKKNQTNNPVRTLQIAYADLEIANYQYVPQTQLAVIPGSIRKQFGDNYVHNYPSTVLNSTQKAAIESYLLTKPFWI
jgi:hypothetical protein